MFSFFRNLMWHILDNIRINYCHLCMTVCILLQILVSYCHCTYSWIIPNGIQGTAQTKKRRMMTWHNLNCLLAQCKSKTNLPWQVQLSWRDPTGISNTLTSQIKPDAWRMCPPRVREKIIKNTDGLSACRKADVDCILMANIFSEVLCFTFSPLPCGAEKKKKKSHPKEDNETQKRSLSKNMKRPNSHCASN